MRFKLFPCIKQTKDNGLGYEGTVVTLVRNTNDSFVVFFPVTEETASIINHFLDVNVQEDADVNVQENVDKEEFSIHSKDLGIYQTMLNSWESSGLFLSGISMDSHFDKKHDDNIIVVNVILSNLQSGFVDSIVRINFQHSLVLASMQEIDIDLSDNLLNKLLPPEEIDENDTAKQIPSGTDNGNFPVDDNLMDIAKRIISKKHK